MKTAAKTTPVLLTIPEAAERLRCSRGHVYTLIADGDLDTVDIAPRGSRKAKTRVTEASVIRFIDDRTQNARRLRAAG
jgi:excisionase family DNA binding protein